MLVNEIEMLLELNKSGTPSIVSLCNILLQKIKYSKLDRYRIIIDGHKFETHGQGTCYMSHNVMTHNMSHII